MPNKPFFADDKKVEKVAEAYRDQDEALGSYDPSNPVLSTPPAAGAEPGTDPTPKRIDTSFARPFGGTGPISFNQAQSLLGGGSRGGDDIYSPMQRNLQQQGGRSQDLMSSFMGGARAGGPTTPFGADQRGALEAGIEPGHTPAETAAAESILGTEYLGPEGMGGYTAEGGYPLGSPMKEIGTALSQERSRANALQTGFGVAGELARTQPDMSRGERMAEAERHRSTPELRKKARSVQRTADVTLEKHRERGREAIGYAGEQQGRADAYQQLSRQYLGGRRNEMEAQATQEVERLQGLQDTGREAYRRYQETGDLEAFVREMPESMLDPEAREMLESEGYQRPLEAERQWEETWNDPQYADVADIPTMRRFIDGRGREHLSLDPDWLQGQQGQEMFPTMTASGRIRKYLGEPDGGRGAYHTHWDPDRSGMVRGANGERYNRVSGSGTYDSWSPVWSGISQQERAEIEQLRNLDSQAKHRERALRPDFGEGGEYSEYRPTGPMAALFGEYVGLDPRDTQYIGAPIMDLLSVSNTMNREDRERVNSVAKLLNDGQRAYDLNETANIGRIEADLEKFINDDSAIRFDRLEQMGIKADEWQATKKSIYRAYKKAKRKKRWGFIVLAAAIALTVLTAGAAAPAIGPAMMPAHVASIASATGVAATTVQSAIIYASLGEAVNSAIELAGVTMPTASDSRAGVMYESRRD